MHIYLNDKSIEHFWEEPPGGTKREFWAFRARPRCLRGERIKFFYKGQLIATSIIDDIQAPWISKDESTGKYFNHWKIFWKIETFEDLRDIQSNLF